MSHGVDDMSLNSTTVLLCSWDSQNPNGEEGIRIISALEADPRERRLYLEQADD